MNNFEHKIKLMSGLPKFLLSNAVVTDGKTYLINNGAVLIEGDTVVEIAKTEEIRGEYSESYNMDGRLLMPGFINYHNHLYSSMSVGLKAQEPCKSLCDILDNFWWPYDKALDKDTVYYSALLGTLSAIKKGVTTIYDHHASMNYVKGSLAQIVKAIEKSMIKASVCFEISGRMGAAAVKEHIRENLDTYAACKDNSHIRPMFGMHANFTLDKKALEHISGSKPEDLPIHIHCGEGMYDLEYCINDGYNGVIDRLNSFGLINKQSVLAHCVYLSDRDYSLINELNPKIISCPDSNLNNKVGMFNASRVSNFLLGTDGIGTDMINTLRTFYFNSKDTGSYDRLLNILPLSPLVEGAKADIAVLDYKPVSEIDLDNLAGHLVFGIQNSCSYMTVCDGKILYEDGVFNFLDEDIILKEATRLCGLLHKRYYSG